MPVRSSCHQVGPSRANAKQPQDLTRINHDHDDDADLFRRHLTISARKPFLVLINDARERLPDSAECQCLRGQSASSW